MTGWGERGKSKARVSSCRPRLEGLDFGVRKGETMGDLRLRGLVVVVGAALLGVSGCAGGDASGDAAVVEPMPNLVGERLDVALSDLGTFGVSEGDVEIVGGGTFGVIDEANWTVCEQRPEAGSTDLANYRLIVDRTCPQAAEDVVADPAETPADASQQEAVGEEAEVESVPESPVVFIPSARRDLRDMRKDVNDMETALSEGGVLRVAGNQLELAFNLGQLGSLGAPEDYAVEWGARLSAVSDAVDELGALIDGDGTPGQVTDAFDATRTAINAALDSLEEYEASLG